MKYVIIALAVVFYVAWLVKEVKNAPDDPQDGKR